MSLGELFGYIASVLVMQLRSLSRQMERADEKRFLLGRSFH
jgi:hypothetical protein